MARYVVLEFEYNEDADDFIKDMRHDDEKVVGLFSKPTLFCKGNDQKGRIQAYQRGKTFSWWVCISCKKPARIHNQDKLMRHVISQGVNLLPGIKQGLASTLTHGWGSYGRT